METAKAPHLRLIDTQTGEVADAWAVAEELEAQVRSLNKVLTARDGKITELRNELLGLLPSNRRRNR